MLEINNYSINSVYTLKLFKSISILIIRDVLFWFIYENSLVILYFLGYYLIFETFIDNEINIKFQSKLFIPGGYPELQDKISKHLSRIGVRIRWSSTIINLECGGYIIITQWFSKSLDRIKLLGLVPNINILNNKLVFNINKASILSNFSNICLIHEYHYSNEISKENKKHQFISRCKHRTLLKGHSKNNIEGSYLHNINVIH